MCLFRSITINAFFVGLSIAERGFLGVCTIVLVVFSSVNLILEGLQAFSRRIEYVKDWENYMEICLSTLTIAFVLSNKDHECFCPSGPQWQLGALVVFMAWLDFILLMRSVPFTAISINMLYSITKSFFKVIALPLLLLIGFGIPLFMLFHLPVSILIQGLCVLLSILLTGRG